MAFYIAEDRGSVSQDPDSLYFLPHFDRRSSSRILRDEYAETVGYHDLPVLGRYVGRPSACCRYLQQPSRLLPPGRKSSLHAWYVHRRQLWQDLLGDRTEMPELPKSNG
jgi:hypothetical protein